MDFTRVHYDQVVAITDLAVILEFGDRKVAIPKSQIDPDDDYQLDQGGEIGIATWLIEKEELDVYTD